MLSVNTKKLLRHAALAGVVLSFVLLYVGAVTLASGPLTIAALAVTALVCLIAIAAF